ncbi:MAG: rubredoxin [Methanomicrobiales archaeon]|nr:rubredoxin [Methanomicrobiales archaeon]
MKRVVSSTTKIEGVWRCDPCRYYYYPEKGDSTQNIPPGTAFEDLPSTWRCPICREPKSMFTLMR